MVEGTAAILIRPAAVFSRDQGRHPQTRPQRSPSSLLATPTVTGESALTRSALDGQVVLVLERELPQAITRGPRGDQNCHRAAFSLDASINISYLSADSNQNTLCHTRPCQAVRSRANQSGSPTLIAPRGKNRIRLTSASRLPSRAGGFHAAAECGRVASSVSSFAACAPSPARSSASAESARCALSSVTAFPSVGGAGGPGVAPSWPRSFRQSHYAGAAVTLLVSLYSSEGIVFAADSQVTACTPAGTDRLEPQRKVLSVKGLGVARQGGVVAYFGLAEMQGRPMDAWLRERIDRIGGFEEVSDFAASLRDELNAAARARERKVVSGLHVGGFERRDGVPVPVFAFVRNTADFDATTGRHSNLRGYECTEDFPARDAGWRRAARPPARASRTGEGLWLPVLVPER
jgi:hypothetical protein